MMEVQNNLLLAVEAHVTDFFSKHISDKYVYHDFQHTKYVVQGVNKIGEGFKLSEKDLEILQLAAWFHDTGYNKGREQHEERSCQYAQAYLEEQDYSEEDLQQVLKCIMATKVPQNPENLLEEIICDADLSHLGNNFYWDRCTRVRQELLLTQNIIMSEQEWLDFEINFITGHEYKTSIARSLYNGQKKKHIKQLKRQRSRLLMEENKEEVEPIIIPKKKKNKKKKGRPGPHNPDAELKQLNLGRGVETMYRTTYRTHVNLSSIADNKANIMLSINAIIISIVVSSLVPRFGENERLIYPTIGLLIVCLSALVFAILATRPKVTEGKFTRADIEEKRSNLLFFGNFYNMDINDFHWGMMEMIKDSDFLYSSMTRDLYYLGVVLAKKYRFLRICYSIFMYGLIASVAFFAWAFLV